MKALINPNGELLRWLYAKTIVKTVLEGEQPNLFENWANMISQLLLLKSFHGPIILWYKSALFSSILSYTSTIAYIPFLIGSCHHLLSIFSNLLCSLFPHSNSITFSFRCISLSPLTSVTLTLSWLRRENPFRQTDFRLGSGQCSLIEIHFIMKGTISKLLLRSFWDCI